MHLEAILLFRNACWVFIVTPVVILLQQHLCEYQETVVCTFLGQKTQH